MKEEDSILRKVGTGNSFKVPGGYFEKLTSEVMNQLPEKEESVFEKREPTLWERMKPWTYMAAMFVGAALIIRIGTTNRPATDEVVATEVTDTEVLPDQYINAALDGSMLDDYSLYVYLSDANEE